MDIRTEVPIRDVLGRVVDLFFAGAAFALDGAIGDEVHAFRDPADNLLGYGNLLYLEGGTHPPPIDVTAVALAEGPLVQKSPLPIAGAARPSPRASEISLAPPFPVTTPMTDARSLSR